jgi:hypothetical protein
MSALVLRTDDAASLNPSHGAVLTMLSSDMMWGAKVYLRDKAIGSIARLYVNEKSGAIERVEISRRIGKPQLFVRWEQLRFDLDPLRIHLLSEQDAGAVRQSLLQRLFTLPSFWSPG